jgi:sRNA-binding regulator protein Hfq
MPSLTSQAIRPPVRNQSRPETGRPQANARRISTAPIPFRFPAHSVEDETPLRHAELFYLQKQIQSQTPMVIILEDGERIEGCIEWYDRNTLKVRGRVKHLIYKSAIKYMYKLGENGQ